MVPHRSEHIQRIIGFNDSSAKLSSAPVAPVVLSIEYISSYFFTQVSLYSI